ncbi:mandelate racemase/muconate lactonizing enzyme family protein [Humitalea sp. 24SJ18S-53]|uniref:mandelate racemase/muconate lactonizing enzyme family protein n=1 Tax=Humitalea sp. 24SJ18S-53 TaxID=3422307 RepID=UPI003D6778FF
MLDAIRGIEAFIVELPRETPYLGPLGPGETINRRGYLVRAGNRTLYPSTDRSLLVKVTTEEGLVGWGETYGIVAPLAVKELIADVIAPLLEGRDIAAPAALHDEMFDLQRVRGMSGGFFGDALAAVDIALWDVLGRRLGVPVSTLLGGARRERIPAYVSGLPVAGLAAKCDMALGFRDQGFAAQKFAAVVSHDGALAEMAALREVLGPEHRLMIDMHWRNTVPEAIALIGALARHDLAFAEAPIAPEDVEGLALVARAVAVPVAGGEEWRGTADWLPRLQARAIGIAQPEMARTGITGFLRAATLAQAFAVPLAPHATVGIGIFLAASLQAASTAWRCDWHEWQHSIWDATRRFVVSEMDCAAGFYSVPTGNGIGAEPADAVWDFVVG